MNCNLKQFLEEKRFVEFMKEIDTMNVVDAADFLSTLDTSELPIVFRMLKKSTAADIFAELEPEIQEQLINSISGAEIAKIMEHLAIDDAVDMLEELPANMIQKILSNTPTHLRGEINRYLKYSENSVGSILAIKEDSAFIIFPFVDSDISVAGNRCICRENENGKQYQRKKKTDKLFHHFHILLKENKITINYKKFIIFCQVM